MRSGHIPGQRVPVTRLFRPEEARSCPARSARFGSGVEAGRRRDDSGSRGERPLYSRSGCTCGTAGSAVYDDSWAEWGGGPIRPSRSRRRPMATISTRYLISSADLDRSPETVFASRHHERSSRLLGRSSGTLRRCPPSTARAARAAGAGVTCCTYAPLHHHGSRVAPGDAPPPTTTTRGASSA